MWYTAVMFTKLLGVGGIILGLVVATSVVAAPPQKVTYRGAPVTSAVPGKVFSLSLQVKNTGSTTYSDVSVIVHIPDGLSHSAVTPSGATISDNTITWTNVPLIPGQSFYPVITLTLEKGTALKTKKNIWVEVTGADMETTSTNFSITAVSTAKQVVTALTSADITSMFQFVYGRTPTSSELTYWLSRRADKPSRGALQGALQHHRAKGIAH